MKLKLACLCLVTSASLWNGHADTLTLSVVADTFINSGNVSNNAGGNAWFDAGMDGAAGMRRGLFRFDLSSIPARSTITSGVVQLTVVKVPSLDAVDSTFDLLRLTAAWGEGTNAGPSGTLAGSGDATWIARLLGTANWTSPGALGDILTPASASTPVGSTVGAVYAWTGPGLANDVQYWLDHSSQNFGWLLRSQSETTSRSVRGFAALENGTDFATLQVGYTPPPATNAPPTVAIANPANGATFPATTTILIQAAANDADGTVTNVEFFDAGSLLGSTAAPPYQVTATLYPGNHQLSARATDNLGAYTTSPQVTVTVGQVVITNPIGPRIPKGSLTFEVQTVADGMASPLGMAVPDDGSGRMFVYDQDGRVWIIKGPDRLPTPLLDVSGRLVQLQAYDERGLLGLAIHPNFAQHPLIYTYTSEPTNGPADFQIGITNDHQSVVAEWRISAANSNAVDLASRREILRVDDPQANHNGGTMRFGPDGLLYITLGDGGQANDVGAGHVTGGNAQDLNVILGKIIRVDVDGRNSANGHYGIPASNPFIGTNALPEIYAFGLRNPFNFSFDRSGGQLYLADVGQNKVEEVDLITAGGNYGWNLREGAFWFDPASGNDVTAPVRPPPPNLIDPIAQYDHDDGSAIIGGFVYRGSAIPGLVGRYLFGDWGSFGAPSGRLFYLDATKGVNELRLGGEDRQLRLWLKGFGEGPDGELYIFGTRWLGPSGSTGRMLKLVPAPEPIFLTGIQHSNGNILSAQWSGGAGPFAVEEKLALSDSAWMTKGVQTSNSATIGQSATTGFLRVTDAAHTPLLPLSTYLCGASEHPTNNSPALGFGIFALDGNTLTFSLNYGGLSSPALAAHIHGPADTATNGPALIDLSPYNGGSWNSNGTLSGVILLTDVQKALLLAGRTYVNFHTAAFPGGEIRGQIAPVNMQVALSGAKEVPPSSTAGIGLGNLTLVGNRLTFNLSYAGLSGATTASHLHGPAMMAQDAGPLVDLAPSNGGAFGSSGSLSGTITLSPAQLGWVIDGLTYINFHTLANSGGEIRGQLLPAPAAVPFTILMSGLAERPTPLTNAAGGTGSLSLEGNTLTLNLTYGGLSGAPTAIHIHGPTNSTANANVMLDLAPLNVGTLGTSGALSGSLALSVDQRNALLSARTYINFHTSTNPSGELRGQIGPVVMTAGLNGVNERPAAVATQGAGMGAFALVRDQLNLSVSYGNLSGAATASHLHGPAGFTASAGTLADLAPYNSPGYATSGSLSGAVPLSLNALLDVIDGLCYLNIQTTNNPAGEIRGQLMR